MKQQQQQEDGHTSCPLRGNNSREGRVSLCARGLTESVVVVQVAHFAMLPSRPPRQHKPYSNELRIAVFVGDGNSSMAMQSESDVEVIRIPANVDHSLCPRLEEKRTDAVTLFFGQIPYALCKDPQGFADLLAVVGKVPRDAVLKVRADLRRSHNKQPGKYTGCIHVEVASVFAFELLALDHRLIFTAHGACKFVTAQRAEALITSRNDRIRRTVESYHLEWPKGVNQRPLAILGLVDVKLARPKKR